jgi:group I intron endonuclease
MACIYKIENNINKKIYVGSTMYSLQKRKSEHLCQLRNNYHKNTHLQNSYNKYGEENLIFKELENLSIDKCQTKDVQHNIVLTKEIDYINLLNPEYNICKEIRAGKLGRILSEEEKVNISKRHKNKKVSVETRLKIKSARALQVITAEQKQKISNALKGKIVSITTINKLKQVHRQKNIRPFAVYKNDILINKFNTQAEAVEYFQGELKQGSISQALNNKISSHKGYTFKYIQNG